MGKGEGMIDIRLRCLYNRFYPSKKPICGSKVRLCPFRPLSMLGSGV